MTLASSSILVMLAAAAATSIYPRGHATTQREHVGGLLMNHQSVLFAVWLGIAVPALVWGEFSVWRARHLLKQVQIDAPATHIQPAPVPVAETATVADVTSSPPAP